ncbi:MAG: YhfC family intramembrane metalloprotease [Bacteroidales bacterium]|nr:YhfC family intramembrane metalloprotease [Candidatus Colimorpha pelethequi]
MSPILLFLFAFVAIAIPIVGMAYWKRHAGGKWKHFFVGTLIFIVFVYVLEGVMHRFCLTMDNPISRFLNGNIWAYALYGGFAAGIFEETGRLVAFKTLMRKASDKKDAISYGLGHGGIEAILVMGVSYLVYAMFMIIYNSNGIDGLTQLMENEGSQTIVTTLESLSPGICCVALLERLCAITFHICASVLVFVAARDSKRFWLYPLAILLHAALDIPAAFCQKGMLPIWVIEVYVAVMAVVMVVVARKVWKLSSPSIENCPPNH